MPFQAVKDAEPLTKPVAYSGMTNLRRLYEDIPMPGRLAVVGDSLAGFNPASVIPLPWNVLIVYFLTRSAKGAPGDKLDGASAFCSLSMHGMLDKGCMLLKSAYQYKNAGTGMQTGRGY